MFDNGYSATQAIVKTFSCTVHSILSSIIGCLLLWPLVRLGHNDSSCSVRTFKLFSVEFVPYVHCLIDFTAKIS